MTDSYGSSANRETSGFTKISDVWLGSRKHIRRLPALLPALLLLVPILYVATLAQSLVLGDPSEYTFVAHILGIAHPPGYAFITLVGKLFQTLIPVGDIPWRMHLLAATAASLAALAVFGTVRNLPQVARSPLTNAVALFAALSVAWAVNYWQHAIHTNPHIITATFLAANLYLLTRWAAQQQAHSPTADRWLYLFCLSTGLGVTHHPLTVFAFPAYTVFIVWQRPSILRSGRTLAQMVLVALLGLSVWLYFPIRSPMGIQFGPTSMNTLNGFLDHVLARNLTVNLFFFGWADQWNRLRVFATLLRLQYSLPVIFLALVGMGWLLGARRDYRPFAALYGLALLGNYAFVMNSVQDVMAYLLGPFLVVGLLAGIGLLGLTTALRQRLRHQRPLMLLLLALFLLGPLLQLVRNLPRVSLRSYNEGQAHVAALFATFAGTDAGAVLLNDWEHMTPLWYSRFVAQQWPDPADVRPEWVATGTANPWLDSVMRYLPGGPVYLNEYRREIVDFGFRLRPEGPFYKVIDTAGSDEKFILPAELAAITAVGGEVELVGYLLPQRQVQAGDYVPLTLALRAPAGTADFYVPVLQVGDLTFEFTTDSHLVSPNWEPQEIVVERFDFALPHDLASGRYPLQLSLKNLSKESLHDLDVALGSLQVESVPFPPQTDGLLANFRQRAGLVSATARVGGQRVRAPWPQGITAVPGDIIQLDLRWRSIAKAEESYTVFVHLIDPENRPLVTLDYTPLGGATPTHLWIPKWLPGQQMLDPYRLQIPPGLPPGTYFIEVGMYEMVNGRRLHISDADGSLNGDRYILGAVVVAEQ